ncbi:hypothetical protein BGP_1223 [Beggiatoa sp. PS]|nr:hypothetical protein BGP_1223 [Beggiatoa sp. PS]
MPINLLCLFPLFLNQKQFSGNRGINDVCFCFIHVHSLSRISRSSRVEFSFILLGLRFSNACRANLISFLCCSIVLSFDASTKACLRIWGFSKMRSALEKFELAGGLFLE